MEKNLIDGIGGETNRRLANEVHNLLKRLAMSRHLMHH